MSRLPATCYLCGTLIEDAGKDSRDGMSMDHVPPKQFYPKSVRIEENLNLWLAPTHKKCNGDYKADEEYFYHALYPLVANANQRMASTVLADIKRRAKQPQSRTLIRGLLKTARAETQGGIHLPSGIFQLDVDPYRTQRIAIKVAQGVYCLQHQRYLPRENCVEIRLCQHDDDVPEMYTASWGLAEMITVCPAVFSFKQVVLDGNWFCSLLFWEAFLFCMLFEDVPVQYAAAVESN